MPPREMSSPDSNKIRILIIRRDVLSCGSFALAGILCFLCHSLLFMHPKADTGMTRQELAIHLKVKHDEASASVKPNLGTTSKR
ncbi:MAG: hypothetical protein WCS43_04495 [Verrucomicrobiota bacterium]